MLPLQNQNLYWKQKSEHVYSKEFSFCYQVERQENGLVDLTRLGIPSNSNNAYYVDCKEDSITLKQIQHIIIYAWDRECHMLNYLHTPVQIKYSLYHYHSKKGNKGGWGFEEEPLPQERKRCSLS